MTLSRMITIAAILTALFGMCCGLPQWALTTLLAIGLYRSFTVTFEIYRRWCGVKETMFTKTAHRLYQDFPMEINIKVYGMLLFIISLGIMLPGIYAASALGYNLLVLFFVLVAVVAAIYIASVAHEVKEGKV